MSEVGDQGVDITDIERKGTVEQLTVEKRKVYSYMMDQMERQVGNYGRFFVEAGYSGRASNKRDMDTRVLLLTEPVRDARSNNNLWVAITVDGPKGIVPKQ